MADDDNDDNDNDDGLTNTQNETWSHLTYNYIDSTILRSTNKPINFIANLCLFPIIETAVWAYQRGQAETSSDAYSRIIQSANFAKSSRIGNCGEYASLAVTYLLNQCNNGVYFMQLTQGDHAWVMLSPTYALDPSSVGNWEDDTKGGDIWVIDGWKAICAPFDFGSFQTEYGTNFSIYWNN